DSQTEQVAVFYLPSFSLSDTHSSIQQCSQAPHIILPLSKNILTKDSLGKLSRGKLRQRYEKVLRLSNKSSKQESLGNIRSQSPIPKSLYEIALASFLCKIFDVPSEDMCAKENFFSVGGSFLEVVQ
ncbi:hypothetical protein K7432_017723, partial [Basidiobolus ranarum]